MKIQIIPKCSHVLFLIIDEESQEAAVVDPVFPDPVTIAVQENNVSLTKVLYTRCTWYQHEVYARLCEKFKDLQFYSGDDGIERLTCKVKHNDTFSIGKLQVRCIVTPYEGTGYVLYYITGDQDTPAIITGSTLCIGGCSAIFRSEPEQLYRSFIEILGSLPNETKVYCYEGDVYMTEKRLIFAQCMEPGNQIIRHKLETVRRMQLEKNNSIMPSTIQEEKLTNPFMRVHEKSVMDHTGEKDPIKIMASLKREWDLF